jgi:hypothetical protein
MPAACVVDARCQLRAGVLVGVVAVALPILLNIALIAQDGRPGGASGASAHQAPDQPRIRLVGPLMIGSGVFVAGVIAIGVLDFIGPPAPHAIRRSVEQSGRPGRVRIRSGGVTTSDLAAAVISWRNRSTRNAPREADVPGVTGKGRIREAGGFESTSPEATGIASTTRRSVGSLVVAGHGQLEGTPSATARRTISPCPRRAA